MGSIKINVQNPCVCGKNHEVVTKIMQIQKNITPVLLDFIQTEFGGASKGCIICDNNTYAAAKNMICAAVGAKLCEVAKLTVNSCHADEFMVEDCEKALQGKRYDYYIAAGAGTIHDITRITAYNNKTPFISYPTAPSVDGFVSGVAPVTTKAGMKITLQSAAPAALFADTDVLAAAPKRLAAAGAGDILGKYVALADWRIANLLTGEYTCGPTIDFEYSAVDKIKESIEHIGSYEKFCEDLLEALVISGICMQYTDSSRPASGAEHHVAHFFEMGILLSTDCLHGENVGLGTILCAERYHRFAASGNITFHTGKYDPIAAKYYADIFDEIIKENAPNSMGKVTPEAFYGNLDEIKNIISTIPQKEELIKLFDIVGGVKDITGLGAYNLKCAVSEIAPLSLRLAPYIRDRLTLLKLMRRIDF